MHERIKILRKSKGFTQQTFADKIKISRNNIASYETGKSKPGDAVISLICREFGVNEEWLRYGTGSMNATVPDPKKQALIEMVGDRLNGKDGDFWRRFITVLDRLDEKEWDLLARMATKLAKEDEPVQVEEFVDPAHKSPAEWTDKDVDVMTAQYRQSLIDEKKAAEESSASSGHPGDTAANAG